MSSYAVYIVDDYNDSKDWLQSFTDYKDAEEFRNKQEQLISEDDGEFSELHAVIIEEP